MSVSVESQSLTLTKLRRPRVSKELVPRPHLLERLNQQHTLTLILAPAGYGKTTLLSTWIDSCGRASAWLSLDEHDSDLVTFTNYLVAAVQTLFPNAGAKTLALLNSALLPPLPAIARSLLNELDLIQQEFILVLDDYHAIHEPAIHDLITELLHHPPQGLHLVLSARHDVPLALASLRARSQVLELRAADLRFRSEEAAILLRQVMKLEVDDRTVASLATWTEGWAAGLNLAALYLRHKGGPKSIALNLPGFNRYVMDYLVAEVLSLLPAALQEFLTETSILNRLSGSLCEAVTGLNDPICNGQAYLEWLEHAGLFVLPLDDDQHWFRYHHLFQQLLLHQLDLKYTAAEIAALHARASAWFAQHGFVAEAISHALAAGDEAVVVRQVEAYRQTAMNQEQWHQLEHWLRLLPRRLIESHPELLMLEAWALYHRFRPTDLTTCLNHVEAVIGQTSLPGLTKRRLKGEIDTLRSQVFYWAGDPDSALELAQQALEAVPVECSYVRGKAWVHYALALQMKGDLNGALDAVHEGLNEDRYHGSTFQANLFVALCTLYWVNADLPSLVQAANHLLDMALERGLSERVTRAYYYLGCAHYQQNDLDAADRDFAAVLERRQDAYPLVLAQSAFGLASVYQARGLDDQARTVIEAVTANALETNSPIMLADVQAFGAHLALLQGQPFKAGNWAVLQDHNMRMSPMRSFFVPSFAQAEVLLALETPASLEEASGLLTHLHDLVRATHNTRLLIELLALQATHYSVQGDERNALASLEQAITLAEPGGFIRLFVDRGPRLDPLLAQLLQRDVAPAYIAQIRALIGNVDALHGYSAQRAGVPSPIWRNTPILAETLTNREVDVLLLLEQRFTNKEIAQQLGISANTVKQHTVTLFQKLQVNNRRQAVTWARENDLLPPA